MLGNSGVLVVAQGSFAASKRDVLFWMELHQSAKPLVIAGWQIEVFPAQCLLPSRDGQQSMIGHTTVWHCIHVKYGTILYCTVLPSIQNGNLPTSRIQRPIRLSPPAAHSRDTEQCKGNIIVPSLPLDGWSLPLPPCEFESQNCFLLVISTILGSDFFLGFLCLEYSVDQ
jgi:hypothetical protein